MRADDTLNFIEALSVNGEQNALMSSCLAQVLVKTNHLYLNQNVPLFAMSYISDFKLKTSPQLSEKILDAAKENLDTYSLKELSYLVLSMHGYFNESDVKDVGNLI